MLYYYTKTQTWLHERRLDIIAYLAIWNIIVFFIYGLDKLKAKTGSWRISEKRLLLCAFFLGGFGAFAGMLVFRHKTKHLKFRVLVPLACILGAAIVFWFAQSQMP